METFSELKKKWDQISKDLEVARRAELAVVINNIRQQISDYRLSAADVFGVSRACGGSGMSGEKFRNPETGQTWNGKGRSPRWFDKSRREYFLIDRGGMSRTNGSTTVDKSVR